MAAATPEQLQAIIAAAKAKLAAKAESEPMKLYRFSQDPANKQRLVSTAASLQQLPRNSGASCGFLDRSEMLPLSFQKVNK